MIQRFKSILDAHSIKSIQHKDKLFALSVYTYTDTDGQTACGSEWADVTDFTIKQLYDWLGY